MSARILLVDDSLTVRMDLSEALSAEGFEVVACSTLEEARAAAFGEGCALVILDVLLPDGDGMDLLAELRRHPTTEDVPVMILSSEDAVAHRVRGLRGGARDYVGKPYDRAHVLRRANELVPRQPPPSDGRPTILVIDDSVTFREQLRDKLEASGYRAAVAGSGEEGLARAASLRPAGIIVDGAMPDLEGREVVRRIRTDRALQWIPCLLLTGSELHDDEVAALDAGADTYLRKTDDLDLVMARLHAILRSASSEARNERISSLIGPKRVLVVDDSITFRQMLSEHLRDEGYEPVPAHTGEEALSLLEVQPVDCILLDLRLPGLSGTEVCREIKANEGLRHIPLVMLTVLEERESMIAGIEAGADDYVTKSPDLGVLMARLRAQLRRKQFEDEHRRIREELLRKDAETREARARDEAKAELLSRLEASNRQLELHARELESLNRELEMFAYSVSHDLRQPLRAIDGFSRMLIRDHAEGLDPKARHYLERVGAGAERMNRLVDGLLSLSRVGRHELRPQTVRVDELAAGIVQTLRETEPERQIEVDVRPGMRAHADRHLLESVLENLLGNAWKFTRNRASPRIRVDYEDREAQRVFYVRDNGAGFDPSYASKLFAPFQRLHSERDFEGTGIGLATVQRIVRRHGGDVWAEGAPDEGATIYFGLPHEETQP